MLIECPPLASLKKVQGKSAGYAQNECVWKPTNQPQSKNAKYTNKNLQNQTKTKQKTQQKHKKKEKKCNQPKKNPKQLQAPPENCKRKQAVFPAANWRSSSLVSVTPLTQVLKMIYWKYQ